METLAMILMMAMMTCNVHGHVHGQCPRDCSTRVVTFNAGLTPLVANFTERRSLVPEALASISSDVDFMCLQEVWFEKDVQAVIDKVGAEFPHHYTALHHSVGHLRPPMPRSTIVNSLFSGAHTMPCNDSKLNTFLGCVGLNCVNAEDARDCVVSSCEEAQYALSQACRSCVSLAGTGLTDIMAECANSAERYNRFNQPGLMVLSKKPLTKVKYVNYLADQKVLVERGYIRAKAGGQTYVCTHLSAYFPIYYEKKLPQFANYREQQLAEILRLEDDCKHLQQVLLGDLNTGPERNETGFPVLDGELTVNYDVLKGLGYDDPYLQNDGRCTFCANNNPLLTAINSQYGDLAIDHILPRQVPFDVTSAKRVLDFTSSSAVLSDHYGVQLDICRP